MKTPESKPSKPGINLRVPDDLELIYANLARISHSPADIVIDFAHMLPNEANAQVRSRVVMTPLSAKLLYRALGENLSRYEAAFGEIPVPTNSSLADTLFRPFHPPDSPEEGKS
jgi:hypothetical protein